MQLHAVMQTDGTDLAQLISVRDDKCNGVDRGIGAKVRALEPDLIGQ